MVLLKRQMVKNTTHFEATLSANNLQCPFSSRFVLQTHRSMTTVPSVSCTQCVVLSACLTPKPIPFQYATHKVYPKPCPGAPQKRERQTEPLGAAYDTLEPIDAAYGAKEPWLFCYMKEGVVFGLAWWEDHWEILNYMYHMWAVSWKQYPEITRDHPSSRRYVML